MQHFPEYPFSLCILCFAPGGHIQFVLQLIAISSIGLVGCSSEYTTFNFFMPRFFNSRLITFARGQTFVLYMSATLNWLASSLLPAPMLLMIGIFSLFCFHDKSNLCCHCINCIYNIIIFLKWKFICILR